MQPQYSASFVARFWAKVDKNGDCWLWTAAITRNGYGVIGAGGKHGPTLYAHRVSYELANGPLAEGVEACHSCDVNYPPGDITYRRCVRPEHLFPGTQADNLADMARKGRGQKEGVPGDRNGSRTHPERVPRGEKAGRAVLTEAQVLEMRRRHAEGGIRFQDLAREYRVSTAAAHSAVTGRTWKHLT
jgi:hypothetical protein